MTAAKLSESEFVTLFETEGPVGLARLGLDKPSVFKRRRRLEEKLGRPINPPDSRNAEIFRAEEFPGRLTLDVPNGTVIIGSDLHAWPGELPTAFRAMLKLTKDLKPRAVIMNGDVIDGASISRHPPLGWEKRPTLIDELEAAQHALMKLEQAAGRGVPLYWPVGNHCARFSTRLATVAPEYAKVHGTKLKDHFGPRWQPCYSVWINDDVVVKHRYRGGDHATWNNTIRSGKSVVTGHLHSLRVTPFTDYGPRTRYGVDCGMLAEVHGQQFGYLEDNPVNWRSGFVVLTFVDGRLLWPEVVQIIDPQHYEFRGKICKVDR